MLGLSADPVFSPHGHHLSSCCYLTLYLNTPQGRLHNSTVTQDPRNASPRARRPQSHAVQRGVHSQVNRTEGSADRATGYPSERAWEERKGDMRGVTLVRFNQISLTKRISLSQSSKRPWHSFKITHAKCFLCKIQSQRTTSIEHIY